jgi:hypothetical protein
MDREHVLRLLDRERRSLAYARTSIDVQPVLTRARAADGSHHTIIFSSLPAADAEAIIDRELSTIAGAACRSSGRSTRTTVRPISSPVSRGTASRSASGRRSWCTTSRVRRPGSGRPT